MHFAALLFGSSELGVDARLLYLIGALSARLHFVLICSEMGTFAAQAGAV
jgi:hypothetical protein